MFVFISFLHLYVFLSFCQSSAKEAEDNIRKALEKGQILPTEERFDSNCITPGIHVHSLLHVYLYYTYRLLHGR